MIVSDAAFGSQVYPDLTTMKWTKDTMRRSWTARSLRASKIGKRGRAWADLGHS